MATDCEPVKVPPAGSKLGVAACGCGCCSCRGAGVACELPPRSRSRKQRYCVVERA